MVDGTYKITVEVLLGHKDGTINLRTQGNVLYADVDAPIVGKQQLQGTVEGDTFTVKGTGKIKLVGEIEYTLHGVVTGDNLHIDAETTKGEYKLDGVRV